MSRAAGSIAVLVAALLALTGCGGADAAADRAGPAVVATYSIAGDMAREVGGDRIDLTVLVGPDGDAHVHEPTPADGVALASADVLIENGLGFETWIDGLYDSSGSDAARVVVSEGISPLTQEGEPDPHIWQSVANARVMTTLIRDGLVAADPAAADVYEANAARYLDELTALEGEVRAAVDRLPPAERLLVTSHDALGPFADAYGFEVLGAGLPSFTTEGADPSAADVAALVEDIRAAGVPAIFVENIADDRLMRRVADEAGAALATPLYTDALGPPDSPGATYLGMMRHNVTVIVDALSAPPRSAAR